MTERKDIGRNGGKKRKVGLKINIDYLLATAYNRVQVAPFFHPYFLLLFLPNILSPSTRTAGLHTIVGSLPLSQPAVAPQPYSTMS
jgi:hypothetical protein